MKKILIGALCLMLCPLMLTAQQLPDSHFENWTGKFNKDVQLAEWHGSNVDMMVKFTLLFQKPGRTGYCAYIANRRVGAMGITEISPGYMSLGQPWQYMKGLNTKGATGGTVGGIAWTNRPDTMSVWIKRVGPDAMSEDFHLLYYAWTGTAKSGQYAGKNGGCTETERVNEQCDIRLLTNGNDCGTDEPAKQVAEGWLCTRAKYNDWTQVKVPVYYLNSTRPSMCNVIFSAGNYPSPGGTDKLFEGNALYVDDVEMIYSSRIDKLVINGKEWKEFDPDTDKLQVCQMSDVRSQMSAIKIEGYRGIGTLTSVQGKKVRFNGRKLDNKEMTVVPGEINGNPWVITVKAEDGSSVHTYRIGVKE